MNATLQMCSAVKNFIKGACYNHSLRHVTGKTYKKWEVNVLNDFAETLFFFQP